MPTTFIDQGYPVDVFSVTIGDSVVTQAITIVDEDDDLQIGVGDTINGSVITAVFLGDTLTIDGDLIVGATVITAAGPFFVATDDSVLQNGTIDARSVVFGSNPFPVGDLGPPCFVKGTLILTPYGAVPVETLIAGDLITTRDNGVKLLRWVGMARVHGNRQFAPVRFEAGVLGNTEPLEVSQQHRMLVSSPLAEMNFGTNEVLVAAKHMTSNPGVQIVPRDTVDYVHIMFDQHEIVCANGLWSESFYYGEQNVCGLATEAQRELEEIFGDDLEMQDRFAQTARYCLSAHEAHLMPALMH